MGPTARATARLLALAAGGSVRRGPSVGYAPGPRGGLDIYHPRQAAPGAPMAIFLYGGTWQSGDRRFYRFVAAALAARGVATAIPDYRIHPQARWPDFLRDCAQAVALAKHSAVKWGADPDRLFLIGHSAGAYNAAMLALDPRWLGEVGLRARRDLAGVVGLAGPYDFLPLRDETLKTIFGPEEERPQTQPMAHAGGEAPPMLLLVGGKDTAVRPGNSVRLARAVRAAGGQAAHRIYPNLGHVGILTALLAPLRRRAPVLDDIAAFLRAPEAVAAEGLGA